MFCVSTCNIIGHFALLKYEKVTVKTEVFKKKNQIYAYIFNSYKHRNSPVILGA